MMYSRILVMNRFEINQRVLEALNWEQMGADMTQGFLIA